MAQPSKLVTAATQTLNQFAPWAERIVACNPLTETSEPGGTGFANIGHGTAYGGAYAYANGLTIAGGAGAISFGSSGLRTSYAQTLEGTTDRAAIRLLPNADAVSDSYQEMTLLFDIFDPGATPGAARYFIYTGAASATFLGTLSVFRDTDDSAVVRLGPDVIRFPSGNVDWSRWNTVMVCVGGGTFRAYWNRSGALNSFGGFQIADSTSSAFEIFASRYLTLGGFNQSGSGVTYTVRASILTLWDLAIDKFPESIKHVNRLLADPWLPIRPAPDIFGEWYTAVCPLVSRPTATSVNLNLVTGRGDTGGFDGVLAFGVGEGLQWRFLYGTSPDMTSDDHCNQVATSEVITDAGDIISASNIVLSDLEPDTEYFGRAEISSDLGSNFTPMPGGQQRFRTQRTVAV